MRLAAALVIVVFIAGSLGGCGSDSGSKPPPGDGRPQGPGGESSSPTGATVRTCAMTTMPIEGLRITAASCGEGRRVARGWLHGGGCLPGADASRAACSVAPYRCSAVRADRGIAVNCARPGRTVAFIVPRGS
jgi:hypothetical protein